MWRLFSQKAIHRFVCFDYANDVILHTRSGTFRCIWSIWRTYHWWCRTPKFTLLTSIYLTQVSHSPAYTSASFVVFKLIESQSKSIFAFFLVIKYLLFHFIYFYLSACLLHRFKLFIWRWYRYFYFINRLLKAIRYCAKISGENISSFHLSLTVL